MKERNLIVFLTATVTLMFLLVMGRGTLLPALALEAPPYYHTQWGSRGSGDGEFFRPYDVAVDNSVNVYVADSNNHRIQKFDSNGVFLTKWGSGGSGDGFFFFPFGVTVDSSGNVYVADTYNHRIQKFDSNGVFVTKWGLGKIQGELNKLGFGVSRQTIANILRRHGIMPAPDRGRHPGWRALMTHYRDQLIACDFFTVNTLFLQKLYVLFFIEVGSRRVHFAGCTANPSSDWVTQQARQMVWMLEEKERPVRFLIRDNDKLYPQAFNTVFQAEEVTTVPTPYRTPLANAYAERYVRSVRKECLDRLIVVNEARLRSVMREYVEYYNRARGHIRG